MPALAAVIVTGMVPATAVPREVGRIRVYQLLHEIDGRREAVVRKSVAADLAVGS
jgi:hypothetical protein